MTKTALALTAAFLTVTAMGLASPAGAAPPGATRLMRGVYTTPEISARCQRYARQRVGRGSHTDSARQSVFIACVRRVYREKYGTTT